jgi:nucleoid-associated protein YgaU
MGLFDFVKEAGAKILGADEPAAQPKPTPAPAASPGEMRQALDQKRALALLRHVQGLGLGVTDLQITVAGDHITVRGKAPSQEAREKVVLAVGNVAGVARVDDQMEVVAPEPAATFYTVERGDTLSAIAKAHYGSANKYMVIFEANQPLLTDPDKIYPGQKLRIPSLPK